MRSNDYTSLLNRSPRALRSLSIVVPWFNAHSFLSVFRHGLAEQIDHDFELIIIDDGSVEPLPQDTSLWRDVAQQTILVRHSENYGGAAALNTGCLLASGDLVLTLDADMAASPWLVAESRRFCSNSDELCGVGFRGTATIGVDGTVPPATLCEDWRAEVFPDEKFETLTAQPSSVRPERRVYRLLEETRDFRDFGYGRVIGHWDLPVMVVGHTVAVDRAVYLDVGGTPEWCVGWGIRDTALGAALVAAGIKIVPMSSVVSTQIAHTPLAGTHDKQLAEL